MVFVYIFNKGQFIYKSLEKVGKIRLFSDKKNNYIWVYNIEDLSLINGLPFKTKTECANNLKISRTTVSTYLDSNEPLKKKLIFSSFPLNQEFLLKLQSDIKIPSKTWQVITGELLGDGHISYDPINNPQINGRLEFTF